jgi:hypothetical protein
MFVLHNFTTLTTNLQRNLCCHAPSTITCKILENPDVLWRVAKRHEGLQGGGDELNTQQRSSSNECRRRELCEHNTLIFNDRI